MLIRFLIFFILFYIVYKIIKSIRREKPFVVQNNNKSNAGVGEELVEDPYCHTYIPISQACKKEIAGKEHYFCSKECSEKYFEIK
jgi:YHS domain-containing protein